MAGVPKNLGKSTAAIETQRRSIMPVQVRERTHY